MKKKFTIIDLIGWLGAVLLIGAYYGVSNGVLEGSGLIYNGMNFAAAVLYTIYALTKWLPPVIVVQVFWGAIAAKALFALY